MGDNNFQKPTKVMPCIQPSDWRNHIDPKGRQKIIRKIIETVRRKRTGPEMLSQNEKFVTLFEEKVFAEALDQQDYLKRLSAGMKTLEESARNVAVKSSMPCPASSVPNLPHSASGSFQSQEPSHTQLPSQTISSPQPQPQQIIPSNTSSSMSFSSISSPVAAVSTRATQASGSNSTYQNSNTSNIARMPPNLKRNSSEHCLPSNPVSLSRAQEQKRQRLQQPPCKNYDKQFLKEQQAQKQLSTLNTIRRNSVCNMGENPIQQPQPHQDQLKPALFPRSQKPINGTVGSDRPTMQSSLSSAHLPNEVSSIKHSEQSVSHPRQSTAVQQHGSFQGVPHLRKLATPQQKAVNQQSSSINRQATEVISYAEKHCVVEAWRENIYNRIMAMKSRYMSGIEEIHHMINVNMRQLSVQHEQSNLHQFEKLKEINNMVKRILRLLNIPKEKLVPGHEEHLDVWEKQIVFYLSKFAKPKNTTSSLQQRSDPRQESLQTSRPHQVVESRGLIEKHLANQYGTVKTEPRDLPQTDNPQRDMHHPMESQSTTSSAPSLRTPPHQSQKTQLAGDLPLVISPGISPSPLLCERQDNDNHLLGNSNIISDKTSVNLTPIQRLVNSVSSISHHALKSSIDDIYSVMSMIDGMEATALKTGSRSPLVQDLARTTFCRIQARRFSLQDGSSKIGETKPCICPVATEMWTDLEKSDHEPTTEIHMEKPRIEAACKLWDEIKDVNQRLIDSQVNVCEEDVNVASDSEGKTSVGTVVKCCFNGVSVNPGFVKSLGCSGHLSTIEPLHLLIPTDYPQCSPILLDKFSGEIGDEFLDLSNKARSKLDALLRNFEDPITLSEIARTWEACAHAVVTEHSEKSGGGTFSSRYGTWENCLSTV